MQYIDYKAYLQEKLGSSFSVVNVREMNANPEKGKINAVITELAGNIYENSAQLPVQIDFYTRDPVGTMAVLNSFVTANNSKMFINEGNYITGYYTTPTPMDRDIEAGSTKPVRLVMFGTLFVMFNIDDISSIKIDGEELETLTRSIIYSSDFDPSNKDGTELKVHDSIASYISIAFKFINKRGVFSQKLRAMRMGTLPRNTVFSVSVTFFDGSIETYQMLIHSAGFASARGQLPSMDIDFVLANQEL